MAAIARFDLTMDADDKDILSRASALVGMTMAAFVRSAAKEKARELLDKESRLSMSTRDFSAFTAALNTEFQPNPALQDAMRLAAEVRRA
jgi:uncharacterized protein (DUF1778 family)